MPERLIDANAAADKIMRGVETHADEIGIGGTAIMIAFARAMRDETDFPTIESEPVRHGRWKLHMLNIGGGDKIRSYVCSECSRYVNMKSDYCPNCGARMDGGADNG